MNRRATDRVPQHFPVPWFFIPLVAATVLVSGGVLGLVLIGLKHLHGCMP